MKNLRSVVSRTIVMVFLCGLLAFPLMGFSQAKDIDVLTKTGARHRREAKLLILSLKRDVALSV